MNNVLDVNVSWFKRDRDVSKPHRVNLYYWLTHHSADQDGLLLKLRATADEREQKQLKSELIGFCPHGEFSYRNAKGLVRHSGILALDADAKDNEHLGDFSKLKELLSQIPEVAYVGLSARGKGYIILIPISYPEQHVKHYKALIGDFLQMGIRIDPTGRNLDRFRYYCYDPDAYFNKQAVQYIGLAQIRDSPHDLHKRACRHLFAKDDEVLNQCIRIVVRASDGSKHEQLLKASRLAGGYIAGGGLEEEKAIAALEDAISQKTNVVSFEAARITIRKGIEYGKQCPLIIHQTADTCARVEGGPKRQTLIL